MFQQALMFRDLECLYIRSKIERLPRRKAFLNRMVKFYSRRITTAKKHLDKALTTLEEVEPYLEKPDLHIKEGEIYIPNFGNWGKRYTKNYDLQGKTLVTGRELSARKAKYRGLWDRASKTRDKYNSSLLNSEGQLEIARRGLDEVEELEESLRDQVIKLETVLFGMSDAQLRKFIDDRSRHFNEWRHLCIATSRQVGNVARIPDPVQE